MRKLAIVVALGLTVAACLVTAGLAAADTSCPPSGISLCDPFTAVSGSISANVPAVYRSGLSFIAGVARRLYPVNAETPGDPCRLGQPGDPCQPFVASFVAFRFLELANAAIAGSGGYSCSAAGVVAGTIRGMHPLYPSDLFAPNPSPIQPGDPCHLLTSSSP
jgi:hypothetical protein